MVYDVTVVGSIIVDFISYVPRLPAGGETIHGVKFATGFGGKGCNQVVAAHKLGSRTAIMCRLGDDSWGADYLKHLNTIGVDTQLVETLSGESTGIAQICVSTATGANHIVIVAGANDRLIPEEVTANAKPLLDQSKVLLCQLETPIPATIRALELFQGISILNAAPGLENIPEELLKLPKIFCVNESEASLITGLNVSSVNEAKVALLKLREMGCRTIIVTLGGDGAIFLEESPNSSVFHARIPKVANVVDTTGAGDCFLGALAHFLALGNGLTDLKETIGKSCMIAALSVQRMGTQSSFPDSKAVGGLSSAFDIVEI